MIIFGIISIVLLVSILIIATILVYKIERNNKAIIIDSIQELLKSKGFIYSKLVYVNKFLSLAFGEDKFAIIENFNPNNPVNYNYQTIPNSFIKKIENNKINLKITYLKNAKLNILYINPVSKELLDVFYEIFKINCLKTIQKHFPEESFEYSCGSDWSCSYFWGYNPDSNSFSYLRTIDDAALGKINLRKKFFTLDIKYNYFEAPIFMKPAHLSIYEDNFLNIIFYSILSSIKEKCVTILENMLYFDNYENIIYLTNGENSIQSILIDEVEEWDVKNNRISFTLKNSDKTINFNANHELIEELNNFIINLNLKKIANDFDYSVDRLINVTDFTKFIVDFSRDRVIYCANLNSLSKFSYLTISFSNLEDASAQRSGLNSFVRIFTKDDEIVDVSCKKFEVAQYIMAQIKQIVQ